MLEMFWKMVVLERKIQRQPLEMFPCEFCKISKNTFFTEHLRTTASVAESLYSLEQSIEQFIEALAVSLYSLEQFIEVLKVN